MTVAELIEKMKEFDPDTEVRYEDFCYGDEKVAYVWKEEGYVLLS